MRTIGNFARPAPATDRELDSAETIQLREPPPVPRLASGVYRRLSPDDERLLAAARAEVEADTAYSLAPQSAIEPALRSLSAARRRLRDTIHDVADRAAHDAQVAAIEAEAKARAGGQS